MSVKKGNYAIKNMGGEDKQREALIVWEGKSLSGVQLVL